MTSVPNPPVKHPAERECVKVTDIIDDALRTLRGQAKVLRSLHGDLVVDTGRRYPDGAPVVVRVSVPPNPGVIAKVTDAGATFTRTGLHCGQDGVPSEHALSVRRELLTHLSVQEHQGSVLVTTAVSRTGEAIGLLADACLTLDAAAIAARHLRSRVTYDIRFSDSGGGCER